MVIEQRQLQNNKEKKKLGGEDLYQQATFYV